MIQMKDLSFSYSDKKVLSHITTTFASGKCHVVLGPSGGGKSTLLKLIAGLMEPTSGEITTPKSYGYVLQEGGLFEHLTILDNISIQAQMLKWSLEKISSRVHELCGLTQFDERLLQKHPSQVSGGQRQRASLMRALFLNPEILLLDESLSALDPLLKYDLMRDLQKIIRQLQKTTILVTHDLMEASLLGDRILLLHDGQINEDAEKSEFFRNPKSDFAKKFIESQLVTR